jgi:hypothetical protein
MPGRVAGKLLGGGNLSRRQFCRCGKFGSGQIHAGTVGGSCYAPQVAGIGRAVPAAHSACLLAALRRVVRPCVHWVALDYSLIVAGGYADLRLVARQSFWHRISSSRGLRVSDS